MLITISLILSFLSVETMGSYYFPPKEDKIRSHVDQSYEECVARIDRGDFVGQEFQSIVDYDAKVLRKLIEQSKFARSEILEIVDIFHKNVRLKDGKIAPSTLERIRVRSQQYLQLRDRLYDISGRYECFSEAKKSDLKGIDGLAFAKSVTISITAALTLYDNYILAISTLEEVGELRSLVDSEDQSYGIVADQLSSISAAANSIDRRKRIRKGILFYEKILQDAFSDFDLGKRMEKDEDLLWMIGEHDISPSYQFVKQVQIGKIAESKLKRLWHATVDGVTSFVNNTVNSISMIFGNTAGLFASRTGLLFDEETHGALPEVKEDLVDSLKPMDILLEKTPFRVTDKFIPGHWGHVAIYLGSKEQLEGLQIWDEVWDKLKSSHRVENLSDSEVLAKFPDLEERLIVEALRPGVEMNSIDHFMNVDDVGVMRARMDFVSEILSRRGIDYEDYLRSRIRKALGHVGKEYDFNFDVNTTTKIVCSELIFQTYTDDAYQWPTEKTMGRHSITPDHVAVRALDKDDELGVVSNPVLDLVLFYHDGKKLSEKTHLKKMKRLMFEK